MRPPLGQYASLPLLRRVISFRKTSLLLQWPWTAVDAGKDPVCMTANHCEANVAGVTDRIYEWLSIEICIARGNGLARENDEGCVSGALSIEQCHGGERLLDSLHVSPGTHGMECDFLP